MDFQVQKLLKSSFYELQNHNFIAKNNCTSQAQKCTAHTHIKSYPKKWVPHAHCNLQVVAAPLKSQSLNAVVMPCDLGWSWANIYGSSVGWLENTKNVNATYLLPIYIGRNQNSISLLLKDFLLFSGYYSEIPQYTLYYTAI